MTEVTVHGIWHGRPFGPLVVHLQEGLSAEDEKREILEKIGSKASPTDLWGNIVDQFRGLHDPDVSAETIAARTGFTQLHYQRSFGAADAVAIL
jgi:hypothetical protein